MSKAVNRVKFALLLVVGVTSLGTVGYRIGGLDWEDALYQTLVTITTVGYTDITPDKDMRAFTIIMVAFGPILLALLVSVITGAFIEEQIQGFFGRAKVESRVRKLEDHIILCGFGRFGRIVAGNLQRRKTPFAIIEHEMEKVEEATRYELLCIHGDATEEDLLTRAGIDRAKGLLTTLDSDAANVYVTLTAKQMNPGVKVVALALDERASSKLKAAGADEVVSPYALGGTWMAQAMTSPHVSDFMKMATGLNPLNFYMEELSVGSGSSLAGQTLRDSPIRREHGVIVLAVRSKDGGLVTNPRPDIELSENDVLVVLGEQEQLEKLKKVAEA
ncbi:MAG: potassium channel family protein [Planctomycetota bacterium]